MLKLVCALMFVGACAAGQTVVGTVVDSVTGVGIGGVTVNLLQGGKSAYSATTDSEGHFQVGDVRVGNYSVRYASFNYAPIDDGKLFSVTAEKGPVRLEARLVRRPRISGRVVDGNGNVVPYARLELIAPGVVYVSPADANGKFDFPLVPAPSAFTLSVAPTPKVKPPGPEPGSDRVLGWARTFYPGVAFPEAATKIALPPGGELTGIELKLLAVPAHAVRGILLNPDGKPAPKASIGLGEDEGWAPAMVAESSADGAFEFPAVVDGEWCFSAAVESGGQRLQASRCLEVLGHDREGVKLQLNPPFAVHGTVVMEIPQGASAPRVPAPEVSLDVHAGRFRKIAGMLGGVLRARPDANGLFTMDQIYPGAYRILPGQPPPRYYLDAIRFGETELALGEVELTSGTIPIVVVYRTNGGRVSGTVEKCASGGVVLVPQDTAMQRREFVHEERCNSSDRYQIDAVRPGEYYLLAFSGAGPLPGYEGLLNQASSVAVRAGENSMLDLQAIPRPF